MVGETIMPDRKEGTDRLIMRTTVISFLAVGSFRKLALSPLARKYL